jgi:hypothetical protein
MRPARTTPWMMMSLLAAASGCAFSPRALEDDAPVAVVAQPEAQGHGMVDAMPVSMDGGVETIPGERTYIVTVQLFEDGRPVNFQVGQEFAVQYIVSRNNTMVVHDKIVLATSPRFVIPKGSPSSAFKFMVQTTKAPGPGYTLLVRVHLGDLTGEPQVPVPITQ